MRISIFLLFFSLGLFSQSKYEKIQFQSEKRIIQKAGSINISDINRDFHPSFNWLGEFPKPGGESLNQKLESINNNRQKSTRPPINTNNAQRTIEDSLELPIILDGFESNDMASGNPLDNYLAISNDGWLVTVANSYIQFQKVNDTLNEPLEVSLVNFALALGDYFFVYDPKVIYDPIEDRFVLTFLNEYDSSQSSVIVGFSATNDPTGVWHLYLIPGNPFNENTWTDYPMVALTENEFFLSVNLLQDNTGWIEGFTKTILWQVDKFSGYNGDNELSTKLWDQNYLEGLPLRNGIPVKGGSQLYGPNLYMISNRNFAETNDSIFLLELNGTMDDPDASINVTVLESPVNYGAPPPVVQRNNPKDLATNDARVLGAFLENNQIHFVGNTNVEEVENSGIFHGTIRNVSSDTLSLDAHIISDPVNGFGYPNLSFTGQHPQDDQFIMTFEHASFEDYPGISSIFYHFGEYSERTILKEGEFSIAGPAGTTQRWGDYSGSQLKYNEPGVIYVNATYGNVSGPTGDGYRHTWVNKLKSPIDDFVAPIDTMEIDTMEIDTMEIDTMEIDTMEIDTMEQITSLEDFSKNKIRSYPNPAIEYFIVEFETENTKQVHAILYDLNGQIVEKLLKKTTRPGLNQFKFSTAPLPPGTYILTLFNDEKNLLQEKIIIH